MSEGRDGQRAHVPDDAGLTKALEDALTAVSEYRRRLDRMHHAYGRILRAEEAAADLLELIARTRDARALAYEMDEPVAAVEKALAEVREIVATTRQRGAR